MQPVTLELFCEPILTCYKMTRYTTVHIHTRHAQSATRYLLLLAIQYDIFQTHPAAAFREYNSQSARRA